MAVDDKRETYDRYRKIWRRVLDFCEGEDAVKEQREMYLPMLPSQAAEVMRSGGPFGSKTLYDLFLEKATVWPGASKTLRAYTGILTRKQPEVIAPEGYDDVFSLAGENIYTTAAWAAMRVMQTGLAGLLVDFPEGSERPYAIKYRAFDILDWRYRVGDGGKQLVFVSLARRVEKGELIEVTHLAIEPVVIEGGDEPVEAYTARTYELVQNDNGRREWQQTSVRIPEMNGAPMGFIPFVPISEAGIILQHEYPMMLDVVNLNKAHYQNDAEYRNALTFAGRPTPCVAGLMQPEGQQEIQLGTSTVLQFEQGGSWGMLGLDNASGIQAIRDAGQDLQKDMAVAGSRALTGEVKGVEAAETAMIHREGEHGQLSSIAQVVSEAITAALNIMGEWSQQPGAYTYDINTDFNPRQVDAQTVQTLWQMYVNGDISYELLWYNMQKGELTPDLRTAEEEKEAARVDRDARDPDSDIDLDEEGGEVDTEDIEKVQDTALNGAQIQGIQSIVQSVADGTLPADSAIQLIRVSFPTIDETRARKIVQPATGFTPRVAE